MTQKVDNSPIVYLFFMASIFVSIACYRDSEIIPTLKDMFSKATQDTSITVGICYQGLPTDVAWQQLNDCDTTGVSSILFIPTEPFNPHTIGVGFSRYCADGLWLQSDYVLQLDSHHRFVEGWDKILIEQWKQCQDDKAILTAYLPNYSGTTEWKAAYRIDELYVRTDTPTKRLGGRPAKGIYTKPFPGKFVSGHFMFSRAQRLISVPNDPKIILNGEEVCFSIRARLAGWNIYHPIKLMAYHLYGLRKNHPWQNGGWYELHRKSCAYAWEMINKYPNLL